ncbi:hypothetical protein K1719_026146 [Acacia pycnantha]|nr:hypothetical protein K1719_026146 [Acacia pycnantha]
MVEPISSSDLTFNDLSSEFDNLPIPSMDSLFFSGDDHAQYSEAFASNFDLALEFGNDGEFEISFDDLTNLHIPDETDDFLLPDGYSQPLGSYELNDHDKQLGYYSSNSGLPDPDSCSSSENRNPDVA